jgi:hypothetical protein
MTERDLDLLNMMKLLMLMQRYRRGKRLGKISPSKKYCVHFEHLHHKIGKNIQTYPKGFNNLNHFILKFD